MLRLHERHEKYCEAGIMAELPDFDDFHMAAISWVVAREWDNPLLSDQVKVPSYRVYLVTIHSNLVAMAQPTQRYFVSVWEAKYPRKYAFVDY